MYFEGVSPLVLLIILAILAAISIIGLIKLRRRYISDISEIFSDKGEGFAVMPMVFAAFVSIILAVLELYV